jgi:hypothetical protein
MYRLIVAVGIAAIATGALGCGSSGEETASASVTKAQFIKAADQVCTKVKDERHDAFVAWQKETGAQGAEAFEEAVKQIAGPSMSQEAEELEGLSVPQGSEQKVARMIENLAVGSEGVEKEGYLALGHSPVGRFKYEAAAFGFKVCYQP